VPAPESFLNLEFRSVDRPTNQQAWLRLRLASADVNGPFAVCPGFQQPQDKKPGRFPKFPQQAAKCGSPV